MKFVPMRLWSLQIVRYWTEVSAEKVDHQTESFATALNRPADLFRHCHASGEPVWKVRRRKSTIFGATVTKEIS